MQLISSLGVGGAERLLIEFLKANRANDGIRQVAVVMNDVVDSAMAAELRAVGIDVHFLDRPEGHKSPKYVATLLRLIDVYGVKLIHSHNKGSKYWALLCKALRRLKVVYTVHDTMTFDRPKGIDTFVHRHFVDASIAISEAVQAQCEAAGLRNVVLARNGVDLSRFAAPDASAENRAPSLICLGRLAPSEKGQDILLAALGLLLARGQRPKCLLVGPETRADKPLARDELEAQARTLGLQSQVNFITDCTDAAQVLPKGDIFVLPSRHEGFGLAALEAMASGLATIVPDLPGPAALVRDGQNGLIFKAGDSKDLADKLETLLGDATLRRTIAAAARISARSYDIRVMAKTYDETYRSLGIA